MGDPQAGILAPIPPLARYLCFLHKAEADPRAVVLRDLRGVFDGFRYGTGRDLTGYEDGTENPKDENAVAAALVARRGWRVPASWRYSAGNTAWPASSPCRPPSGTLSSAGGRAIIARSTMHRRRPIPREPPRSNSNPRPSCCEDRCLGPTSGGRVDRRRWAFSIMSNLRSFPSGGRRR